MYKYTLCFIRRGGQMLMLNRQYGPNMGTWNGIGGKIEAGETPRHSVIREVLEESGIPIEHPELAGTVTWITPAGTSGMVVYLADVPDTYHYPTPVRVTEGILDWKDIEWVLDKNNRGISGNVQQFLPLMLSGERNDHQYRYDAFEVMIDYVRNPIQLKE
ncbi:NUDIX hydrolase [Paenibacillus sp. HJGM_3]|uniref:NUDIX hydrolase n=1 Tax=Paenibacillus sp. HJGM_3 TaxID=3379816 RepID=UPI00385FFF02